MNHLWLKKAQPKADLLSWIAISLYSVCVFTFLVRSLDKLSLWMDEGFYYLATQKILEFGYPLFPSGHVYYKAIFYAYILAFFAFVFGFTVFNLRLISVFATLALIPVVYLTGKRYFSRLVGLAAVVLFSLSVWEAEYSRTVLYFAPLQLVSLLGVYLFYRGFFEDKRKSKILATVVFIIAPLIHQLGMGVWFCYPAFFFVKGAKRFFRKDVLISLGATSLFYVAVQVHEFFFWKVGYVYAKTDFSLKGMWSYFFGSFSLSYFREFYRSFPLMSLIILAGFGLLLLCWALDIRKKKADGKTLYVNWLFLGLCLVFPLMFLGFFRTHIQPRYLYQLYPLFLLLYVVSLYMFSQVVVKLGTAAFSVKATSVRIVTSGVLFIALLLVSVEGVGVDKVKKIFNRHYKDPIRTDIISRSGRHEHYDHRGVGEYVRHFVKDDDLIVANHVVFQYIYAGRVDYWLWSGGPGTWDAWEETADGWKDFYIGARWINNLSDLETLLAKDPARRFWIIASPSIHRTDHIKTEIAQFIREEPNRLVFKGKDGMSEVYLWNEDSGQLTGGHHSVEGEWLPVPFGQVRYSEDSSKGCALYLAKDKDGNRLFHYTTEEILSSGHYKLEFRLKGDDFSTNDRLFGIAIETKEAGVQDTAFFVSADMLKARNRYQDFGFSFYHRTEGPLQLKVLFTGKGNIWLDYCDFKSVDAGPTIQESADSDVSNDDNASDL
ncbi:glycosyltransferase family 39 protein [Acidobacteriota bacterium]